MLQTEATQVKTQGIHALLGARHDPSPLLLTSVSPSPQNLSCIAHDVAFCMVQYHRATSLSECVHNQPHDICYILPSSLYAMQGWLHSSGFCAGIAGSSLRYFHPGWLCTQSSMHQLYGHFQHLMEAQSVPASGLPHLCCHDLK